VGMCVFFLSFYIAPYYVIGDQAKYTFTYEGLAALDFADGYEFYFNFTGGREPFYFLIVWLSSGWGIDKNIVMALSNALLAMFAMKLFAKWKTSVFVAMAIIISNFYMVVLYFAAERLKFAVLFFVISLLYVDSGKRFYALVAMAVTSHFQMLLLYVSMLFNRMSSAVIRLLRESRLSIKWILIYTAVLAALAVLGHSIMVEYIIPKSIYYAKQASDKGVLELLRVVLFLILSLWYSSDKKETVFVFIPLIVAALIVGGDRINMFGYFVFLYYGLRYKGGVNAGVLVTTAYFAWKAYLFVADIMEYGYGYASI
jgi:hypothetical protein